MCAGALFVFEFQGRLSLRGWRIIMLLSHVRPVAGALLLQTLALSGLMLAVSLAPAMAQAPAAPVDPAFEASKKIYESLPEADRKAIQDGLIWTGDYKGNVDGEFGRGTRAAIVAFAQRSGLPTDGTLDVRGRSMLVAAAGNAKNAVGFAVQRDPKTGASIGIPAKILPKRTDTAQGSRWQTPDGNVSLETVAYGPALGDLPAIFDALKESTPTRKVTYRLLRPDFLVISGEIGRSTFYTRISKPPADQPGPLRGYTFTYLTAAKTIENVGIAIANSWSPVSTAPAAPAAGVAAVTAAGVNAVTGRPAGLPAGLPAGASPQTPQTPQRAAAPSLTATGIVVAADKVLTLFDRCTDPRIAGRPATVLKRDADTGLTLLQVAGLNGLPASLKAATGKPGSAVLALFLARKGAGPDTEASVAPGEFLSSTPKAPSGRLLAPVQAEGQGAPVFDRAGSLVGIAGRIEGPRQVAGILPQRAWPLVSTASVSAMLASASLTLGTPGTGRGELSAGELSGTFKASLVPLLCLP